MPRIGITGGVATGKSTVARMLRDLGAVTFSADEAAREVLEPGSQTFKEVIAAFGGSVLKPDGSVDRTKLGEIVFSDERKRKALERITHPAIRRLLNERIEAARAAYPPDTIIAVEIPLLYEAGMEGGFDEVVVVAASEQTEIRRLTTDRGLTRAQALERIRAQAPLKEKAARADHVVLNDGGLESLSQVVGELWKKLGKEG
jgi:dephospho-CoA kinase